MEGDDVSKGDSSTMISSILPSLLSPKTHLLHPLIQKRHPHHALHMLILGRDLISQHPPGTQPIQHNRLSFILCSLGIHKRTDQLHPITINDLGIRGYFCHAISGAVQGEGVVVVETREGCADEERHLAGVGADAFGGGREGRKGWIRW